MAPVGSPHKKRACASGPISESSTHNLSSWRVRVSGQHITRPVSYGDSVRRMCLAVTQRECKEAWRALIAEIEGRAPDA